MSNGYEDLKTLSGCFNILITLGHCPRPQTNDQAYLFYNDFRKKITLTFILKTVRVGVSVFFYQPQNNTYHNKEHVTAGFVIIGDRYDGQLVTKKGKNDSRI